MIILLYGQDNYRSRQKLNEIVERYKKIRKSGLNLKYFNEENIDWRQIKNEIQTVPMFSERKLIVLTDVFGNREFKENFLKNIGNFKGEKNTVLFLEENPISSNDPLFKLLKKEAKYQEFKPLCRSALENWIKKELKKYASEINHSAMDLLIYCAGNDLWQISQEIKKLASYKQEAGQITKEDVALLVKPKPELGLNIFATIDAIAFRDKKRALEQIRKHLENGESPLYLLSMINFQFRNLLQVKNMAAEPCLYSTTLTASGLHPYVFKKSRSQAERFTGKELKEIYDKIFRADLNIKTGKISPETAIDLLIADI